MVNKNAMYCGDLNSKPLNSKLIWMVNFYLFGIKINANQMVQTIRFMTVVKSLETKFHWVTELYTVFYLRRWITDHLMNKLFWTIWVPSYFAIQIPTVDKKKQNLKKKITDSLTFRWALLNSVFCYHIFFECLCN